MSVHIHQCEGFVMHIHRQILQGAGKKWLFLGLCMWNNAAMMSGKSLNVLPEQVCV